jgi:hypothetical protein
LDKETFSIDAYVSEEHAEKLKLLVGKVSLFALEKIKKELAFIRPAFQTNDCVCSMKYHYGLPCRHTLPIVGTIPLSMIPCRWHLFPSGTTVQVDDDDSR